MTNAASRRSSEYHHPYEELSSWVVTTSHVNTTPTLWYLRVLRKLSAASLEGTWEAESINPRASLQNTSRAEGTDFHRSAEYVGG